MGTSEFITLTPRGRLDAANAPALEAELKQNIAAGHVRILVDMSGTRYISSNGLRALLAAERNAKKHGGAVKLCRLSARLVEVFEMAGFDRVFDIYASREEAAKSFPATQ